MIAYESFDCSHRARKTKGASKGAPRVHRTANLAAVTTGDVVNKENKHDLLGEEEIGQIVVKGFVQDKLIKKYIGEISWQRQTTEIQDL